MKRLVVVGGGVSGLTVAHRSMTLAPDVEVTVLESEAVATGKLRSISVGDLVLPSGADSFVARKPWAADLCRELGLELEPPGDAGAYLWTERGLVPYLRETAFGIPGDVGNVLRWPGLSRAGRRRALQDLVRGKRKGGGDETLGGMLRRRLGDEATDLALGPLLAGLHAGDVDRLSVRATFPELVAWEASQGSLVRGAQAALRAGGRGDAGPMFVRPRGGVESLTEALRARLGSRVRTRAAATAISRGPARWMVRTSTEELAGRRGGARRPGGGRRSAAGTDLVGGRRRPRGHPGSVHRVRPDGVSAGLRKCAAAGDRVRRPARTGADDGLYVVVEQVALPAFEDRRCCAASSARRARRTSLDAEDGTCRSVPPAPAPALLVLPELPEHARGRSVAGGHAAVRARPRGAGRRHARCLPARYLRGRAGLRRRRRRRLRSRCERVTADAAVDALTSPARTEETVR